MSLSIPKFGTWATEANYPAGGDWGGKPCKVQPVGDLFIPATKPPAEYQNYLINQLFTQDQTLIDIALGSALSLWIAQTTRTSLTSVDYDTVSKRWIFTDGTIVYDSFDGGVTHNNIVDVSSSFPGTTRLNAACHNGEIMVAALQGSDLTVVNYNGRASITDHNSTGFAGPGNENLSPIWWDPTTNAFLAGVGNSGGGSWSFVLYNLTATHVPANPTLVNAQTLPSGFSSGSGSVGLNKVFAAVGPSFTLLALNGTATQKLGKIVGNGAGATTTTDVTPTSILTGGSTLSAAAYNSVLGLWGLIVTNSGSTVSTLYTSPDGVTWTSAASLAFTTALAAIGDAWVISTSLPLGASGFRPSFSQDNGATWHTGTQQSAPGENMVSNGNQVLAWTATYAKPGSIVGPN